MPTRSNVDPFDGRRQMESFLHFGSLLNWKKVARLSLNFLNFDYATSATARTGLVNRASKPIPRPLIWQAPNLLFSAMRMNSPLV
jgi:hypothetical protein